MCVAECVQEGVHAALNVEQPASGSCNFSRPSLRRGNLNSFFQVALYLRLGGAPFARRSPLLVQEGVHAALDVKQPSWSVYVSV